MSDDSAGNSSSSPHRRASFSPGQTLSELFGRKPSSAATSSAYPGPISSAAANAQAQHRRRLSVSTHGGGASSGSPPQSSPTSSGVSRRESVSSSGSGYTNVDENAIEEGDGPAAGSPNTAFGRRLSFGARALRDVRVGNANGRASTNLASSPTVKGRGEGFNWSDSLRSRAERGSVAAPSIPDGASASEPPHHQRAASIASMETPVREMPRQSRAPDHFQERILKGDFYMD
ncbi:MAG: hypothetical protein M1819_007354 [Sarea resinae]|nr:MAG: hypothetical protein M1819_007354 [Sarea resinae]